MRLYEILWLPPPPPAAGALAYDLLRCNSCPFHVCKGKLPLCLFIPVILQCLFSNVLHKPLYPVMIELKPLCRCHAQTHRILPPPCIPQALHRVPVQSTADQQMMMRSAAPVKSLINQDPLCRRKPLLPPHAVYLPEITVNIPPSHLQWIRKPAVIIGQIYLVVVSIKIRLADLIEMPHWVFEVQPFLFWQARLPLLPPLPRCVLIHDNVNFPVVRFRPLTTVDCFLSYHLTAPSSCLKIILYTSPETS